jgi:hypothetical protein
MNRTHHWPKPKETHLSESPALLTDSDYTSKGSLQSFSKSPVDKDTSGRETPNPVPDIEDLDTKDGVRKEKDKSHSLVIKRQALEKCLLGTERSSTTVLVERATADG